MTEIIGQRLGNYQITQVLGEGGFAYVFLGRDLHLDRQAAIKVLKAQLEQREIEQFRIEAKTIAQLDHPNIVQVWEFGLQGTLPFLVMKYAPNGTLRKLHHEGISLPLSTVSMYVRQIADALQYAHDRRLIHRDIKPENILLGSQNELLLSDFGISVLTKTSQQQSTRGFQGTMAYAAPEQIQGRPVRQSDQYALAIMAYEWLTGNRPFQGSMTELIGQHLTTLPASLSDRIPSIPRAVEQVVLCALAKDPAQRFGEVKDFAIALEQACMGQSTAYLLRPQSFPPIAPTTGNQLPHGPLPRTKTLDRQPYQPSQSSFNGPLHTPPYTNTQSTYPPPYPNSPYPYPQPMYSSPMTTNGFQPSGQSSPAGEKGRKGRKKKSDQTPQPYPTPPLYPAYPYGPPPINIINNNANANTNKVSARQVVKQGRTSTGCCAVIVVVVLLIIGASIYQSVNSHFRSSGPPTTTQIPAPLASSGKTAYNVNWSKGMSNWSGSAEWKVIEGGLLGSDGSSDATNDSNTNVYRTLAPYHPTIPDYAVEAQIQFIRFPSGSGDFGILTRTDANDDGYLCGFTQGGFSDLTPFVGSVKHGASNISSIGNSNSSFTMDGAYHTFLVEMNGNRITFFVDKQQIAQITDNTYLSPGRIGLRANNAVIDVRSFQVLVL